VLHDWRAHSRNANARQFGGARLTALAIYEKLSLGTSRTDR
jgi:hypothetical protein